MSNRRRGATNIDSAPLSIPITHITPNCDGIDEMRQQLVANGRVLQRIENQANIFLSCARIDDTETEHRFTFVLGGRDQPIAALQ